MSEMTQFPVVPAWTLGWRMQRALAHAGVGIEEIADELGVSRSTVSRWINDHGEPKRGYLKLWAMRCGVPFSWLAEDSPERGKVGAGSGNLRFLTLLRAAA